MNTPIGDKLFQDIPHRVARFRKNRPRDIEKSVDEKILKNIAGDCKKKEERNHRTKI